MAKVRAKVKTKAKDAVSPRVARMLRKVIAHILDEPLRYDQDEVLVHREPGESFFYTTIGEQKVPQCGTIGCLAGWVTALSLSKKKAAGLTSFSDPISFAAQKLGFSDEQRSGLFGSTADWPLKFSQAYHRAKTPLQIAKVAAKRVEWFIKTGE